MQPVATIEMTGVSENARAIVPLVRANSERCDRERCVPAEIVDRIRETGLFRIFQPKRYGGLEGSPQEFFDAVAAIGGGCASTGWVAGVLGSHQFGVSHFSQRAQDDVWGETPDSVVVATGDPSRATAHPVNGGYRITGTWRFASGCGHATWQFVGATLTGSSEGPPKRAFFLIPAAEITYLDTWHVTGLRGSGSKDAVLTDCFVPEHRMLKISDIVAMRTPGALVNTAPLYRIALFTIIPLGILAPVVGATARAAADYIGDLRERVRGGGVAGESTKPAESPVMQRVIAQASGTVAAVVALIETGLLDTWNAALADEMSVDRRVRNRRDYALAVRLCTGVVDALYENSPSDVLYLPNALERVWRDVHAASKHNGLNWDAMGTMSGRHLTGLAPRGQY